MIFWAKSQKKLYITLLYKNLWHIKLIFQNAFNLNVSSYLFFHVIRKMKSFEIAFIYLFKIYILI